MKPGIAVRVRRENVASAEELDAHIWIWFGVVRVVNQKGKRVLVEWAGGIRYWFDLDQVELA